MKAHSLGGEPETSWLLVFDVGDEVVSTLTDFALDRGITAARFNAVGAFKTATLAYFDLKAREYRPIPVDEQVEVASLTGNVGMHGSEPKVHIHAVLGREDGRALAGHLLDGHVRPTLELMLVTFPVRLERVKDEATGLPLFNRGGAR